MPDETPHHFVYVLRCGDNSLYTGYTIDVTRRVQEHQAGRGARYTRSRLPVQLLCCWAFPSKQAAMAAEWAFKRLSRREKLARLNRAGGDEGIQF